LDTYSIGVYLSDWYFIGEATPDFLADKPTHINFNKRYKAAEIISQVQLQQQMSYNLVTVEPIQRFVATNVQDLAEEEWLYDRSILLEPRGD
jgi:son of sevenless